MGLYDKEDLAEAHRLLHKLGELLCPEQSIAFWDDIEEAVEKAGCGG